MKKLDRIWFIALVLIALQVLYASADAPQPTTTRSVVTPETTLDEPTATPQPTTTPVPTVTLTPLPTATPTLIPTSTPNPSPTPPGTAHISILASETVIPISGTETSELFVALLDVQPGIYGFEMHLLFDPTIAQVVDADGNPENGTQVTVVPLFGTDQTVTANRANNETGTLHLAVQSAGKQAIHDTEGWHKVAIITWAARAAGKSSISMTNPDLDPPTLFLTSEGTRVPADAIYDGTLFVRMPGTIKGTVQLQGRPAYRGITVSAALASTNIDETQSDLEGAFTLTTSHGEGFYILTASMPGYLTAESDSPVRVTLDSTLYVGEVTLLGGDTNGDNRIDVRDLSYIAWHFDEYDPAADVNGDGVVDISDLTLTASNFGREGPTTWHTTTQNTD